MILSLSRFDYFSWISTNHCIRGNIMGNNRTGTNNCAISDFDPSQDDDPAPNPNIISYFDWTHFRKALIYHWDIRSFNLMIYCITHQLRANHHIIPDSYFSTDNGTFANSGFFSQSNLFT